ncbi:MAG: hypothetical protein FJW26_11180 [Acidimicrobiia bacterium]|nr:hypothetical protein [Acidimicrobiia bacterium]
MLRFLSKLLGARTIEAETLGILNLCGDGAAGWAAADKAALAQLFQNVKESEQQPPGCNLLLLYCTIDNDGSIVGSRLGLREIIRDSGAPVVVVASPNSGESYKAGAKERPYGQANLVMTIDRKGEAFGQFFQKLFGEMKRGRSMPAAWVKLAPQGPHPAQAGVPDTVFFCELGPLVFR